MMLIMSRWKSGGELRLYEGRVVQLDKFLADVQTDLAGVHVAAASADSFKDKQAEDFMDRLKSAGLSRSDESAQAKMAGMILEHFSHLSYSRRYG